MKTKKQFQSNDLLQMSTEDFINYIETCFDPEVNSEFDPSVIRQVLEGEGAQEFKSLLISTLLSKDNDGTPINDKLQVSTRRTTRQFSVSSSYKTRKKIKVNEFQLYKRKFKLKKCKVILTDIAHSNNRPSKLIKSSPKRRKIPVIPVTIKQEIEINYEPYFNCDICCRKFSNEAKFKNHHKKCQIFKYVAPIPITKVKTEEVNNNSDPNSDFHPEDETDTESDGASDSDSSKKDDDDEEEYSENENNKPKKTKPPTRVPKPGEKIFTCPVCQKYFFKIRNLNKHKEIHNPNGKFKCPVCPGKYRRKIIWQAHILDKHLSYVTKHNLLPIFPCTVSKCSRNFASKVALIQHLSYCHKLKSGPKFNCEVSGCSEKFKKQKDLIRHKLTVHGILSTRKRSTDKFICLNCELRFNKLEDAAEHEETHKIEKPFKCEHCYKRFTRKDHLKRHQRGNEDLSAPSFSCTIDGCKATFKFSDRFRAHVRCYHKKREKTTMNPCPVPNCSSEYTSLAFLNQHLQTVHPDYTPFTCEQEGCGKKFPLKKYLTLHKTRVHDKMIKSRQAQGYPCTFEGCTNFYSSPKTLKAHLLAHRGDFKFKCEAEGCSRKFTVSGLLRQHMKTHSLEKPLKCPHCPFATIHKTSLKVHVMSHNGSLPLTCPHCPKKFPFKNKLENHIRAAHTENPFPCTVKDWSNIFPTKHGLRHHFTRVHLSHQETSNGSKERQNFNRTTSGQKIRWKYRRRNFSPIRKSNKFTRDVSDLDTSSDDDTDQANNVEKVRGQRFNQPKFIPVLLTNVLKNLVKAMN